MPKRTTKPNWEVLVSDCTAGMNSLPIGSVDLVLCDSPYNIGKAYDSYDDNQPHDDFMDWVQSWLAAAWRVMAKEASIFIWAPDEWASEVDVFMRRTLKFYRRGWIIWYYTFGVANQKNWSRSHTHILYYTRSKTKFTFNADEVRVPSARQLVYGDKRQNPKGKLPDNTWMLLREQIEPYMTPDQDTWLESRVCGTFHARKKHSSNQIPIPVYDRIIKACSNPGDVVLDPFLGTAGSGVSAFNLGRKFIGFDISKTCVKEAKQRLSSL